MGDARYSVGGATYRGPVVIPQTLAAAGPSTAETEAESTWGRRAVGADTSPFDGSGVVVAVLDSGIDASHPAFQGANIVTKNFTDEDDADIDGHGTFVAGALFGGTVDGKHIGIAPGVEKALVAKVLGRGGGSTAKIFEATAWAIASGASVISMSLGIDFVGYVDHLVSTNLPRETAVSKALDHRAATAEAFAGLGALANLEDVLLCATTGNESDRAQGLVISANLPGSAHGFIAAGALAEAGDGTYELAKFSNGGADVCGPGVAIVGPALDGDVKTFSGTAMAAPHVAGVAALWAQKLAEQSSLTADALRAALLRNAKSVGLSYEEVGSGMAFAPQD